MPRKSELHQFSLDLRAEFPLASHYDNLLRLRWGTVAGEKRIQIVGKLRSQVKGFVRTLDARTGMAAWKEAREVLAGLLAGTGNTPVHLATGALRRAERRAYATIEERLATGRNRQATADASTREIRRLVTWLTERNRELGPDALIEAIRDTDPRSRARRSRAEAAVLLAKCGELPFTLPEGTKPRGLKPKTRTPITDAQIIEFCEGPLLRLKSPEAIWLLRCTALTGLRGGDCFALELPDGPIDAGTPIPAWCSKKGIRFTATPSIKAKWQEWEMTETRPTWRLPSDRRATNDQVEETNSRVREATRRLRTDLKGEGQDFGFRALRHAAGARLLEMGVHSFRVAELLATSENQLQRVYSGFFKAGAANEVARLIGAQTVPSN